MSVTLDLGDGMLSVDDDKIARTSINWGADHWKVICDKPFGKDFFERQYQQQPAVQLDYNCGIQVWHADELVGVLNQTIAPGQRKVCFALFNDGDPSSIEIPIRDRHVIVSVMDAKFGRSSITEFKRHHFVPRYAQMTEMIHDDTIRFEWPALDVSADALDFLFDMDSFEPL